MSGTSWDSVYFQSTLALSSLVAGVRAQPGEDTPTGGEWQQGRPQVAPSATSPIPDQAQAGHQSTQWPAGMVATRSALGPLAPAHHTCPLPKCPLPKRPPKGRPASAVAQPAHYWVHISKTK